MRIARHSRLSWIGQPSIATLATEHQRRLFNEGLVGDVRDEPLTIFKGFVNDSERVGLVCLPREATEDADYQVVEQQSSQTAVCKLSPVVASEWTLGPSRSAGLASESLEGATDMGVGGM